MSDPADLLDVDEARHHILRWAPMLPTERTPLPEALGRALAEPIRATRTLPPWDNSAMDGYALQSADTTSGSAHLRVADTVYAGQRSTRTLARGECARIMTGAPLPPGADAVLMQERVTREGDWIRLNAPVSPGTSVRAAGEDAVAGEPLLEQGTPLGVPEVALLWGQGITEAQVPRRPRVALLSTGDELRRPGPGLSPDHIVDVNTPSLAQQTLRAGGIPSDLGVAPDARDAILEKLKAAPDVDVMITSAGVSVGERDFVKDAWAELGVELKLWRVAMRPGKPLAVGRRGATLFIGLPGNPASALVTFELFVRPALRRMLGHAEVEPPSVGGRTAAPLRKAEGLTHFVRVHAKWHDGDLWAQPLATQTSGAVRSTLSATHLLVFPREATALNSGDRVRLMPVSWGA